MTPEELLRPRYKLIADYPGNSRPIGFVFVMDRKDSEGRYTTTGYLQESFFTTLYPHLFKKLEWWEERRPEDMPEYLCSSDKDRFYKVNEWCGENSHGEPLFRFFNNVNYLSTFCAIYYEPATEAEYLQYTEFIKQTTMNWTTTKPTEPCVFVTAIWRNGQWFYEVFELSEQRNPNGEYMLLDNEGNLEYFGINDFKADRYCVLPKNQQQ